MSAPAMRLDFAATGVRPGSASVAVLAAGVISLAATLLVYDQIRSAGEGLALRRDALSDSIPTGEPVDASGRSIADATAVIAGLSTPWGQLLDDLEAANVDSRRNVAILEIEPDREHQKVRIIGESRTLRAALSYAERLQKSKAIRYPLLDSHEVQLKDPFQPVRFQITAAWRVSP
ncbi:MAG: hypothetical protein IT483_07260 [Gammaproteobacteria bacterium]|nr:hypothetical protein [Gammaproteobacteria bacterium]